VMIVLTAGDRQEAERLAGGAPTLQRLYGMPIDPAPRARPASSEPACRAVVAARLFAPHAEAALLRRLCVLGMAGALFDDAEMIAQALAEAGIEPGEMGEWLTNARVTDALNEDMRRARSPSQAAHALGHKLSGPPGGRRYSAPSYELSSDDASFSLPGFNPIEAYDAAIANLAPDIDRRPSPTSARAVLAWASEPLATAEVAMIMNADIAAVHAELARVAVCLPAGADAYWSLDERPPSERAQAPPALVRAVAASRELP